jgi:hypothetical protein
MYSKPTANIGGYSSLTMLVNPLEFSQYTFFELLLTKNMDHCESPG